MPRDTKKVLMVQHASGLLDFESIRKTLKSLSPNDKITVLAIIQKTSGTLHREKVKGYINLLTANKSSQKRRIYVNIEVSKC